MCGIAGIHYLNGSVPDEATSAVKRMTDAIAHRGPDDDGIWKGSNTIFGFRRLSIIDLESGHQPMISPGGSVIVFNGEIYNYKELRSGLEAQGEVFTTSSDTEVLQRLYDLEGPDCLNKLNGMFALAIFDAKRNTLFLARDRMGKKPLFIFRNKNIFAFASEIKALLTLPEVQAETDLDLRALSDFLSFGYVLTPKTIFTNIEKLAAAHHMRIDLQTGAQSTSEYWSTVDILNSEKRPYDKSVQAEFSQLFDDAVRLRLRSDVPLGGFLSGGIDSASVVAAMAKMGTAPPNTFSVGFEEKSFDESVYAQAVAEHLNVPFELLKETADGGNSLERLIRQIDEPFADTSILPTYTLNQAARKRVSVALSGDGGDEILAGYATYRADQYFNTYRHLPLFIQKALLGAANALIRPSYKKIGWDYKARQFLGAAGMSRRRAHIWWREIFSEQEKSKILSPAVLDQLKGYDPVQAFEAYFDRVAGADFLDQALYVDQKTWLQDDILVKADRMSMAHSLEVRSPFLDYRLVEFMAGLSPDAKINAKNQKVILKDAMRQVLPGATLARAKRGFNAPTGNHHQSSFSNGPMPGLFRNDVRFDSGRTDMSIRGFAIDALNAWLSEFTNGKRMGA